MCFASRHFRWNVFSQRSHLNTLGLLCKFIWISRSTLNSKLLQHSSHCSEHIWHNLRSPLAVHQLYLSTFWLSNWFRLHLNSERQLICHILDVFSTLNGPIELINFAMSQGSWDTCLYYTQHIILIMFKIPFFKAWPVFVSVEQARFSWKSDFIF